MPNNKIYLDMIKDALDILNSKTKKELETLLPALFTHIFNDLKSGIKENPIEHHLTVLQHALEITNFEGLTQLEIKRAAVLALLHDIAPTKKITTQMVEEARLSKGEAAAAELEQLRKKYRIQHMQEGAETARKRMEELNTALGNEALSAEDMDIICDIIAIHDNPSNKIPITKDNLLAVAQREADRLWMITLLGVKADLSRKGKDAENEDMIKEQVEWNKKAFTKERKIYNPDLESFVDDITFFRTRGGHKIYTRWCEYWEDRFQTQ